MFEANEPIIWEDNLEDAYLSLLETDINWLHGTNSTILAYLLKTSLRKLMPLGWLINPEKTGLPAPLFPLCGVKDAGFINPLSGQWGINAMCISGMHFDRSRDGLTLTANYAKCGTNYDYLSAKPFLLSLEEVVTRFLEGLNSLTPESVLEELNLYPFPRQLMNMHMKLQSIMLLHNQWPNYKQDLIDKITQVIQLWQHADDRYQIVRNLKELLVTINENKLPFVADDEFKQMLLVPFPMIIGAQITKPFISRKDDATKLEANVEGEIDLCDVKIILTPEVHKENLEKLLLELDLTHIQIISYQMNKKQIYHNVYSNPVLNFQIKGQDTSLLICDKNLSDSEDEEIKAQSLFSYNDQINKTSLFGKHSGEFTTSDFEDDVPSSDQRP